MRRERETAQRESGIAPIMLVILGGGGYAALKLADPECQEDYASCFFGAQQRARREGEDRAVQREQPSSSAAPLTNPVTEGGELVRRGAADYDVRLSGNGVAGAGSFHVDYDTRSVTGSLSVLGNASVELTVAGSVDPETGQVRGTVSGNATQDVNTGPLQGSVSTLFTGELTGTLSDLESGSGSIDLTQRVTKVEGNLKQIRVGKTDKILITWKVEAEG